MSLIKILGRCLWLLSTDLVVFSEIEIYQLKLKNVKKVKYFFTSIDKCQ